MSSHETLIVGGGLAGLTAGAYLSRAGKKTLLLEKSSSCGGLVQTFQRDGFTFDTGPRALGNAGILEPMLRDLGLDLPTIKGEVSLGIGQKTVHFDSPTTSLEGYLAMLGNIFPSLGPELRLLGRMIEKNCRMVASLNSLPNPFFYNPLADLPYLFTRFIPWLPSFLGVALKTGLDRRPIEQILDELSTDRSFKDLVSQHFFKGTPHSFALGYFENFQDYRYPLGGTGQVPQKLQEAMTAWGGSCETGLEVMKIIPARRLVLDQEGREYEYRELLWAGDLRSLYTRLDTSGLAPQHIRRIERDAKRYAGTAAGESVFTLFLAVDETPDYFGGISRGHFIYTPDTRGMADLHRGDQARIRDNMATISPEELASWVRAFCARNSYEISIPVLKDPTLAPPGSSGLIVSLLFDGEVFAQAEACGRLEELTSLIKEGMINSLDTSIYHGLRSKLRFALTARPLSLRKRFGATGGAITGWSLEGRVPVPASLAQITAAVETGIPHICRAGQWSYSPSGAPVAILTGRIAAARMLRRLGGPRKTGP